MMAISRLVAPWPPNSAGRPQRSHPAASARRRISRSSSSHLRGTPPLSKSAYSLAAVVEEPDVVVLLLERPDLAFDELVQSVERRLDVLRDVEVHGSPLPRPGGQ